MAHGGPSEVLDQSGVALQPQRLPESLVARLGASSWRYGNLDGQLIYSAAEGEEQSRQEKESAVSFGHDSKLY